MRLTDCNGTKVKAYSSLQEAIENYDFSEEELNNEKYVSLGVGKDAEGNYWFVIERENYQTNCNYRDLQSWKDWFDKEWIEEEA